MLSLDTCCPLLMLSPNARTSTYVHGNLINGMPLMVKVVRVNLVPDEVPCMAELQLWLVKDTTFLGQCRLALVMCGSRA